MSPEGQKYVPLEISKVVKKDPVYAKAESYLRTGSWGAATNKRLSVAGNWRK